MPNQHESIEEREAAFWDAKAAELDENALLEPPADDPYTRCRIELLGDLRNKRLLDIGCGTGLWTVALAKRGANVCAVDISPESIAAVKRRVDLHRVSERVEARVMSATSLDYAAQEFDVVHGQDIIHHVDASLLGQEVARVLVPDGRAVFHENCANNKLLMFARDRLCGRFGIPKWSSGDEYPLTRRKLGVFASHFASVEVRYPQFVCFHYIDAKFFKYKRPVVSRLCGGVDALAFRIPFFRRYSYMQVICCTTPISNTRCETPSGKYE